jgi:uncharacterized protein involved in exopolysaccharide biosynthesis
MATPPIIQGSPVRSSAASLASVIPVFVTVFLLVVIISTAITFILPESYASTARIKVEPEVNPGINGTAYDPYFLQTTFEIIQSQLVLDPVIAKLNLNVEWGKKYFKGETLKSAEALEILKARTSLAPVRGTKLIAITVYSDDRNEAARLANAIADSYWAYRVAEAGKPDAPSQTNPPVRTEKVFGTAGQLQDALEKTMPVLITDRAEPGRYPVKPNKPLNIALGVLAGIVLGSVAALLVRLFRSRP